MQTLLALALVVFAAPSMSNPDVTGAWWGPAFAITFQQDGTKISGKGGPDAKEQYPFTGTIDGDHLLFKVGEFDFDLRVSGDEIKGQMKTGNQTMEVAVKRVPTAFEVASIKPNNSGGRGSSSHSRPGGEIILENYSLKRLVERAYDVKDFSISCPDWMDTTRFDIIAKPPAPVAREEMNVLMQSLLADRFKLVIRRETKTMSAYELVVGKGGLKVKAAEPGYSNSNSNSNAGKGTFVATKITMGEFATFLSTRLDRPVVDKTEVKGVFDMKLEWTLDDNSPSATGASTSEGPTIFTAIQEQLGLKLVAQKLPVEIVVVDHAEKVPTEN